MPTSVSRWPVAAAALVLLAACSTGDKMPVSKAAFAPEIAAGSKSVPNLLSLGQSVSGALEATDPLLPDSSHFDTWIYPGRRGDSIQISLESSDFDAFLLLFRQAGDRPEQIAENDDGGGGRNARITAVLPADGEYAVLANSYRRGQKGAYTLRMEGRSSAPSSTQTPATAGDWAARYRGGGDPSERYALLVGIDDYEGTGASTLDGPVADANLIGRILVELYGFRRENVVTIADREATREHIAEAFLRHLGQAGPEGVAVFYYSGHGMRMPNNVALTGNLDPEPADNRDEALYIRGDDTSGTVLLDDELGFLADRLRTDRVLFIVDACFSGTGTRAIGRSQPKEAKFVDVSSKVVLPARYLTDGARKGSPASDGLSDLLGEPRRHVLLAASTDNQESYTADGWPKYTGINSVFTYYLAEALEAASPTATFAEVMRQVTPETDSYVQRRKRGVRQTPQAEGQQTGARIRDFLAKR